MRDQPLAMSRPNADMVLLDAKDQVESGWSSVGSIRSLSGGGAAYIGATHRDEPAAIADAVADLYALSGCSKIIGSYWSSFTDTAAELRGIERGAAARDVGAGASGRRGVPAGGQRDCLPGPYGVAFPPWNLTI